MKNVYILSLFFLCTLTVFSQDLVVTSDGDSINCRITKVKSEFIYFTFMHQGEIRSTLLPVSQVVSHRFGYYPQSEVPMGMAVGAKNYKQFRLALNGGYSYLTAKLSNDIPSDFKDYTKDLKSGYHFGTDFTYFFSESFGFGARYLLFKSSNSLDNIYVEDIYGNRSYGKMQDDLNISFIGPTFSTRLLGRNKENAFIINISFGYMGYRNDGVLINPYKLTGSTMGTSYDISYDIGLSKKLSLGFQLTLISGLLSEYRLDDGTSTQTIKLEKGEYEGLGRIDLSVGLRFGK